MEFGIKCKFGKLYRFLFMFENRFNYLMFFFFLFSDIYKLILLCGLIVGLNILVFIWDLLFGLIVYTFIFLVMFVVIVVFRVVVFGIVGRINIFEK